MNSIKLFRGPHFAGTSLLWALLGLILGGIGHVGVLAAPPIVSSLSYQDEQGQPLPEPLLERVQARMQLRVNQPFSRYALRQSIKAIYALGTFVQITAEGQTAPGGGLHVRLILEQKTRIRSVTVQGNHAIKQRLILETLHFAPGEEYTPAAEEREKKRLLQLYRDRGYFQARVRFQIQPVAPHEVDLQVLIEEGPPARISEIVFEGVQAFKPEKLRDQMQSRPGKVYRAKELAEDVKRLEQFYRERGYVSVTIPSARPGPYNAATNTIPIQIRIQEGLRLVIRIEGNERISTREIEDYLKRIRGRYRYTDYMIQRNALDIKRLYQQRGYSQVEVSPQIDRSHSGEVRVYFLIREGRQFTVSRIEFVGNRAFSDKRLRAEMRTRPRHPLAWPGLRWLFSEGVFDEEQFKTDLRALELFYRQHGYRTVKIRPETLYDERRGQVALRIHIEEGPQSIVRSLTIVGNRALPTSELRKGLQLQVGKPLNEDALKRDRTWLENRYRRAGYIRCLVTPQVQGEEVTYRIEEGPRAELGKIRLRGNQRTKSEVILREFRLKEGAIYDAEEIAATRQRIFGLGLFRDVDFKPLPHQQDPQKVIIDLEVRVNERPAGTVNIRGGYSPSEKIRGTLEVAHRNLYGRGRRLGAVLRLGTGGNLYEVNFVEPWLFHTRTRTSVRLFRDRREELDNLLTTGGMFTITRNFWVRGIQHNLSLQYRYETLEYPHQPKALVSSIGSSIQRDTRDDLLDPTQGSYHQLSVEYAGAHLGGNNNFIKLKTDHRWYRRYEDSVLALAVRAGYGEGLRTTKEIAAAERFRAGGASTLRGFSEFSLGEKDATGNYSGDVMLILNAELRFPIHGFLGGACFIDAGNVWGGLEDWAPLALRANIGVGLRLATPIGPARIDYGFPLVRRPPKGFPGKIWFVLGQAF